MDLANLNSRYANRAENFVFALQAGRVLKKSHAELHGDVMAAVELLRRWGVKPGMRVGIRASNCYEWLVYDLALLTVRALSVAFTDDFNDQPASELIDGYSLSLLLVRQAERSRHPPELTSVAYIDGPNADAVAAIERPLSASEPDPDFTCPGLIFSSGSSGGLKGLVLCRSGIEVNVATFTEMNAPTSQDRLLIFLPISNFQQRLMYYGALWYGFDVILTDPTKLFHAFQTLQPTILIAPPVFYELIATRFSNLPRWKRIMGWACGTLCNWLPVAAWRQRLGRAVFKEVHNSLGGRMRIMITGMAPIKRSTLQLCRTLQLPLFETYGLIECGPVALNLPGANRMGSVGKLLPGVQLEIAKDGELIVRKESLVTSGYFQCAEGESERTYLGGNRVATGDIGRLDRAGYLHLVGRKKEIIVTGGGEKIHPETVESCIDACPDVAKSVVLADAQGSSLIAVVSLKAPADEPVRGRVEQFVRRVRQPGSPMSIGKIVLTDVAFTRENGLLRPNLKLDRQKIAAHFRAQIESTEVPVRVKSSPAKKPSEPRSAAAAVGAAPRVQD